MHCKNIKCLYKLPNLKNARSNLISLLKMKNLLCDRTDHVTTDHLLALPLCCLPLSIPPHILNLLSYRGICLWSTTACSSMFKNCSIPNSQVQELNIRYAWTCCESHLRFVDLEVWTCPFVNEIQNSAHKTSVFELFPLYFTIEVAFLTTELPFLHVMTYIMHTFECFAEQN